MHTFYFKFVKFIFLLILSLYICAALYLYIFQRSFVFKPTNVSVRAETLPGFEKKAISISAKETLTAWFHPGDPLLVFAHGNTGNILDYYADIKPYIDKGWGVFAIPYPGYAGESGKPSEESFYRAAKASLKVIQDISPTCMVIMGRSLGTAVATWIAQRYQAAALILISPPSSTVDIGKWRFPFFPIDQLMKDRFDSYSRIDSIRMPLLIFHGTEDKIVPYMFGAKLYEKAKQPKKMITLENVGHNPLPVDEISKIVFEFIEPFLKHCSHH